MIKFKVIITAMPHVGPCTIIRQTVFESGVKFELIDAKGCTWHKRWEELTLTTIPSELATTS